MPRSLAIALPILSLAIAAVALIAGPLDPPTAPIAPTYKTLTEVEPRVAINAVNTPGDANSVFRITQPGSYYLTGNIQGEVNKHGIAVAVSNVTIDLNGFALIGVNGSRSAIIGNNRSVISVRNGTIFDWELWGIDLTGTGSGTLDRLVVSANSGGGVRVGWNYAVSNCSFSSNTGRGLYAPSNCTISDCTASSNWGVGFEVGSSTINACAANNNIEGGIDADLASSITDCTASGNSVFGVRADAECVVRNNAVRQTTGGQTAAAGILITGSNNRVEGNNTVNCTHGIRVETAGNLIISNSASNCSIGFAVTGAQTIGPIISATGTISSSNPWANFSY